MICPNCDGYGRLQYHGDGTYPHPLGDTRCSTCEGSGYMRSETPPKFPTEDQDRVVRNLDKLMLHMNPVEFACYEVMNHAGDLAVALLNTKVVDHLNQARMEILLEIERRITDRAF